MLTSLIGLLNTLSVFLILRYFSPTLLILHKKKIVNAIMSWSWAWIPLTRSSVPCVSYVTQGPTSITNFPLHHQLGVLELPVLCSFWPYSWRMYSSKIPVTPITRFLCCFCSVKSQSFIYFQRAPLNYAGRFVYVCLCVCRARLATFSWKGRYSIQTRHWSLKYSLVSGL